MKATLETEIVRSYKRLSYTHWHALAEFVDNSTQAYLDNKSALDKTNPFGFRLRIEIEYDRARNVLSILDNSIGMNETDLQRAMKIGLPPMDTSGRSRYGLGLKTAACWFGDVWSLTTKKLGEDKIFEVTFNVDKVANGNLDLGLDTIPGVSSDHFTKIEIHDVHRNFAGRTVTKIKDYLRSFYRKDIHSFLDLFWGDEPLKWNEFLEIEADLIEYKGKRLKQEFSFDVNGKQVVGWAGVFLKGSRSKAGFSILHNDRVIQGWPESYKPSSLFGEGRNDLINQRLVGEIDFGDFEISHTKDQILYGADEEDIIEDALKEQLAPLVRVARDFRKSEAVRTVDVDRYISKLGEAFAGDLTSEAAARIEKRKDDEGEGGLILETNESLFDHIIQNSKATKSILINDLAVELFITNEVNSDEQYILFSESSDEVFEKLSIVINANHPYFSLITSEGELLTFFRSSVYDAFCLWDLSRKEEDAIRAKLYHFAFMKDELLRAPVGFESDELEKFLNSGPEGK